MTPGVSVDRLVVGYGSSPVARVERLTLSRDRVTLFLGPNGSGKTTLLKTLAGLLRPLEGTIRPKPRGGCGGAVFVHSAAILFRGTVRRNLLLASEHREKPAREALEALGVSGLWEAPVTALSTGQRQRVALARALAARPALLLVDEPEGGMDAEAIKLWRGVLTRAVEARGPIVVVAAHRPAALEGLSLQTLELRATASGTPATFAAASGSVRQGDAAWSAWLK